MSPLAGVRSHSVRSTPMANLDDGVAIDHCALALADDRARVGIEVGDARSADRRLRPARLNVWLR